MTRGGWKGRTATAHELGLARGADTLHPAALSITRQSINSTPDFIQKVTDLFRRTKNVLLHNTLTFTLLFLSLPPPPK
jgi:hypothetical protein